MRIAIIIFFVACATGVFGQHLESECWLKVPGQKDSFSLNFEEIKIKEFYANIDNAKSLETALMKKSGLALKENKIYFDKDHKVLFLMPIGKGYTKVEWTYDVVSKDFEYLSDIFVVMEGMKKNRSQWSWGMSQTGGFSLIEIGN